MSKQTCDNKQVDIILGSIETPNKDIDDNSERHHPLESPWNFWWS